MPAPDEPPVQVLVVGPDEIALAFIDAMLTRAGLTVTTAPSGRVATAANTSGARVVLVDRDLEAVRSVRALADPKRAAIPVVVLGADGEAAHAAAAAREAGATHFVARPVTEPTLVSGLRSIAGH